MRRREFISLLGGTAAAWPITVRAQRPATAVVGVLITSSIDDALRDAIAAFRRGLTEAGLTEGKDVTVEYRSAEG
jgi:hypothetical protein